MERKKAVWAAIGYTLAAIFLLQAMFPVKIIPLEAALKLLGLPGSIFGLMGAAAIGFCAMAVASLVAEVAYSLGMHRSASTSLKTGIIIAAITLFLAFWLTLASYAVLALAGIAQKTLSTVTAINIFLFWLFMLRTTILVYSKKQKATDAWDDKRITWISCLRQKQRSLDPKGGLLHSDSCWERIVSSILMIVIAIPVMTVPLFFLSMPVSPAEAATFIHAIAVFAIMILGGMVIFGIGQLLSRRVQIYENRLEIPLPTFANRPLFTAIIPKGVLEVQPDQVRSYKLYKERVRRKGGDSFQLFLKLTLTDGTYLLTPLDSSKEKVEKVLTQVMRKCVAEELTSDEKEIERASTA